MYRKTVYTPSRFSRDAQTVGGGLDTHVWDVILTQNVERLRDALQPSVHRDPPVQAEHQGEDQLFAMFTAAIQSIHESTNQSAWSIQHRLGRGKTRRIDERHSEGKGGRDGDHLSEAA